MVSLYKRATPSQKRIFRVVEGAIRNTMDAHPDIKLTSKNRRGIAKRAAGILSAQWLGVLSARRTHGLLTDSDEIDLNVSHRRQSYSQETVARKVNLPVKSFPWGRFITELSRPLSDLRRAGEVEKVEARVEVLRLLAEIRAKYESR